MALLGEQLLNLAKAAGMSGEEPELKSLLSNTAVSGYEIPDTIADKFTTGLLSVEAAKSNPKIKAHYFAQAYNGLDSELANTAIEFGFTDEEMTTLNSEKSSTKRAIALAKMKVSKLESELKKSTSATDKADVKQQIIDLNNQIAAKDKLMTDKIAEIENSWKEKYTNTLLSNMLASQSFADEAYKDENYLLPMVKIKKALNDKGVKIVLDNESIKLEQQDGADYFENNVKVDTNTFVSNVLAQNKFLKVSKPNDPTPPISIPSPTRTNKFNMEADRLVQEAMIDLTR